MFKHLKDYLQAIYFICYNGKNNEKSPDVKFNLVSVLCTAVCVLVTAVCIVHCSVCTGHCSVYCALQCVYCAPQQQYNY